MPIESWTNDHTVAEERRESIAAIEMKVGRSSRIFAE